MCHILLESSISSDSHNLVFPSSMGSLILEGTNLDSFSLLVLEIASLMKAGQGTDLVCQNSIQNNYIVIVVVIIIIVIIML